jgi:hypothetical protein
MRSKAEREKRQNLKIEIAEGRAKKPARKSQ